MSDLSWVDTFVEQSTTWVLDSQQRIPPLPATGRIEWQRDGLRALWFRMEDLKLAAAQTSQIAEECSRLLGAARAALRDINGQHDDTVGQGLTSDVSTMTARGMAADERRIAHDTKAMPLTIRRRRLERLVDLVDGHSRAVNQHIRTLDAERYDCRAQLRAIDVGLEIGEL